MKTLVFLLSIVIAVSAASGEPFVVIVRHAERDNNDPKDPDITAAGRTRAEALARMLKDAGITAIFVTEFKRTQETAAPLAKATGIQPTVVNGKDYPALLEKLHQLTGNGLIVAHGNTIPDIIKALGIEASIQIPDGDYANFFVVTLGSKPQLLRLRYPE